MLLLRPRYKSCGLSRAVLRSVCWDQSDAEAEVVSERWSQKNAPADSRLDVQGGNKKLRGKGIKFRVTLRAEAEY